MRGFVAVAVCEINERRIVLIAAAAAAVIPLLVPLLPNLSGLSAPDVRGTAAWMIALGLSWVLAASFGFSMVATDLAEGRSGFLFSRPIGALPIWIGKVVGNYLLVLLAELVVFVPVLLLPQTRSLLLALVDRHSVWNVLGLIAGVPLVLVLVANAAGVMWRARSGWSVVDLAAALILSGLLWLALSPLYRLAPEAFNAGAALIGVSFVLSLFGAGAAQTAAGRTDVQRGHRALSLTLWGGMTVATFAMAAYSTWVFSVAPDDLSHVTSVDEAPAGNWIVVGGETRWRFDFLPQFLLNTETGHFSRLELEGSRYHDSITFSRDGERVVWFEPSGRGRYRLSWADLGDKEQVFAGTGLFFDSVSDLRLSAGGDRVAVREGNMISVYEIEREALLISAPVPAGSWVRHLWFATNDMIRVLAEPKDRPRDLESIITISEIDIPKGSFRQTGSIERGDATPKETQYFYWEPTITIDSARDRVFVVQRVGEEWRRTLRDARTGEVLEDFGKYGFRGWAEFLDDGRLVWPDLDGERINLVLLSPGAEVLNTVQVGYGRHLAYGGEVAPGVVTIGLAKAEEGTSYWNWQWTAKAVDLNTGATRIIDGAGKPANEMRDDSSGGGRLFFDNDSKLVIWDPVTATTRGVLDHS